ncbi:MAG: hypothetical protein MI757_06895, partial [Pirellulales bacterium]|nr:hypothetical protein [Pirellulales bacterium]
TDRDVSTYPVPDITAAGGNLSANESEFTLLRSHPQDPSGPLFSYISSSAGSNTAKNPYFYYRPATRLGSLLSVQSNVYAVWITVGYFEVEQTPKSAAHPDGYRLKKEVGWNSGNVIRHRGFWIFDRTRSDFRQQAFVRGSDDGVDDCFVIKRIIE